MPISNPLVAQERGDHIAAPTGAAQGEQGESRESHVPLHHRLQAGPAHVGAPAHDGSHSGLIVL